MTDEEVIERLIELNPHNRKFLERGKERGCLLSPKDEERLDKLLREFFDAYWPEKRSRRERRRRKREGKSRYGFRDFMWDISDFLADVCHGDAEDIVNTGEPRMLFEHCNMHAGSVRDKQTLGEKPFETPTDTKRAAIMLARCDVLEVVERMQGESRN